MANICCRCFSFFCRCFSFLSPLPCFLGAAAEGASTSYDAPPPAAAEGASTSFDAPPPAAAEGASTSYDAPPPAAAERASTSYGAPSSAAAEGASASYDAASSSATDVNLEDLIQHICKLLELIKASDEKQPARYNWPSSSEFLKLKEILSEGREAASSLGDIIETAQSLLKPIGQLHWATLGLLVVSDILERFEAVSTNRDECISLLEEMYKLAKYVKELKERPRLRKKMDDLIQEALGMIVKASIMCCVQISSSKFSRFFLASVNKQELLKFQEELKIKYRDMRTRFDICFYDDMVWLTSRPPTPMGRIYPDNAVGIEEPLKEVVTLLEWESEKNAVAVMVYGFGGVGKSTLADAVFARLDIVGCKYSMVRLFDDITSTPNILDKQKCILRDLGIAEEIDIRKFEDGQQKIRFMLEKEVAFLYIDNVLHGDMLQQLLPRDMPMAKKVRVLITARDKSVRRVCTMETKDYSMNGLPRSEATVLLKKEMKEGELASNQLNQIIEICGGIPKLLTVVAGFIRNEEDKQKAFRIVMEDKKHLKGQAFGDGIEHYVFAYDLLPEKCKEPFLDICIFFKGMDWDSVADIVGESELDTLEKRALVSKDKNMDLTVHDVILMIGNKRAEETRFRFTNADRSQFEEFIKKDTPGIKGLWFDEYKNPSHIPAIKLDSMSNSLKILRLGNLKVKGKCDKIFEKLVFLQVEVPHLPFNISQMPPNLKHMELNGDAHFGDFEISPSGLQRLRNLRTLRLIHFAALKKLPKELGDIIHGLRELSLSWCTSLEELPRSISNLQYLRVLKMDHCPSLSGLPEDIGSLSSLQQLSLAFCIHIEELPESTSKLQSLQNLNMVECKNLKHLPNDFESLHSSLQVLCLRGCESLKDLPRNFEKFRELKPFGPLQRNIPKRGQVKAAIAASLANSIRSLAKSNSVRGRMIMLE